MKTPIEVRLVGPALLCQAVEALLASISPIYLENTATGPPTGSDEAGGNDEPNGTGPIRRRLPIGSTEPLVVLLVGDGWQNRVVAESRLPRRGVNGGVSAAPRYALIADGNKIDFYGARKMAVNAFIGTDEPISVLVQGIQSAAQNKLFCSPQLLPALIDAVGSGGATGSLGDLPAASANGNGVNREDGSNASQAALLSAREHEVALHAARGLSNEQIAVFLGISVPTVKFHLMHAFRKLGIQRRTQLYAYMPFLTSATEALLPPVVE